MKKLIILMLALYLILPLMSAEYIPHRQYTDFSFSVTSNNATICNVSDFIYPNGTVVINENMNKNGQTFSITIEGGNFSALGIYCFNIQCFDGASYETGSICRDVTYAGYSLGTENSIIYIGLLGILVFILFVTFWGMGYLPNSNQRDEEGKILSVTYLKYLRLPLWLFAYFLFIAVIFLSSNIAYAFLSDQLFSKLLFSLYYMLMAFSPLVIIILLLNFFIRFYHDREFQNMLNRGMYPGANL